MDKEQEILIEPVFSDVPLVDIIQRIRETLDQDYKAERETIIDF